MFLVKCKKWDLQQQQALGLWIEADDDPEITTENRA